MADNILKIDIKEEIEQSLLDYGMSIISDRALPSAEDGLKPVNRRILYDMFDKGYLNNKKFVKCAQPVGDTMGRFHPHGDSSIYGALAWMSQPWNMRYPLISWHGNNGSRDGDEPAASRYTECKLSKLGEEMLRDIKKETVDWQNAYTDEEQEPIYLPGLLPNLIVNGTSGIAWAMACSFAPHNLREVMDATIYTLENEDCDPKDLLKYIKGPDFPTGGLVINANDLEAAYVTGRGSVRMRGEYIFESNNIVFTSIPYKVSKEKLTVDIDKLCEDGVITGVKAIRDESNQEGVRFVIELDKTASAETVISKLFKETQLEDTYSFNQVALVDKKPKLLNIKDLIDNYIKHQTDVLLRKTTYNLNKIKNKIHILDGLLIALANIDDIIKLIKGSASAAAAETSLIEKYNLTSAQAKAILDMKLSKLAKLESIEVQNEKNSLVEESNSLTMILEDPKPELKKLFEYLKNTYGDDRRTTITQVTITKEEKEIEFVEPEKCVVVLTESGLAKRIPSATFKAQKRAGKGIKTQDDITSMIIRTNTIDNLMVFTNQGRMYRILVNDIPEGTNTTQGTSLRLLTSMEPNEEPTVIYSIYRDTEAKFVLFITKNGLIKKTALDEYTKTKKKCGISAISLKDNDSLASVSLVKNEDLIIVTKNGMGIKINADEIGATGRTTTGIKGINLSEDDEVITCLPIHDTTDKIAIFSKNGLAKKIEQTDLPLQKRAGKGLILYKPTISTGDVAAASLVNDEDNILIMTDKTSICIKCDEIPSLGRQSVGNQMIKTGKVLSVSKI